MVYDKLMVLDVLKPHEPSILELSKKLSSVAGVGAVDITIVSVDRRVETAKVTIEGGDFQYDKILKVINDYGATVKSIDRVSFGKKLTSP
ncbi:DUF211 domain-containing protein [Candidatus Woesearchaeota archaeon]|nr:DUF211 domain-containing protein [Candidatus Woesearchaeota archaeon]